MNFLLWERADSHIVMRLAVVGLMRARKTSRFLSVLHYRKIHCLEWIFSHESVQISISQPDYNYMQIVENPPSLGPWALQLVSLGPQFQKLYYSLLGMNFLLWERAASHIVIRLAVVGLMRARKTCRFLLVLHYRKIHCLEWIFSYESVQISISQSDYS